MAGWLLHIRRQAAFARSVPPAQILRRAWLIGLRRAQRVVRPALRATPPLDPAQAPPAALFRPRRGMIEQTPGEGWAFSFIGRRVALGRDPRWHAPEAAAMGQLWRMNLHYMEYLEEVDDTAFAALATSWIAAHPPYARGATTDAWNAYAVSLRVVVWMQQLAARRGGLPCTIVAAVESELVRQLVYLERHLETDIGGNHLIKNIKALAWAGAYFAGSAAIRWRQIATRLLERELPRQFLPDGMHFELSPSYHCQVFADCLEIRHALGNGAPLLDQTLIRAAQAVADLVHPDGDVAQFGDSGLHMAYSPAACLAAYGEAFGSAPQSRPVFAFHTAGYFGMRAGQAVMIADAGRIAPAVLPAHGHGDALSFEWSVAGDRVIVDQGVFEYVPGERRAASRSAHSHNTLSIEGVDQADFYGSFRCGRQARVRVLAWEPGRDGFRLEACHDGYTGIPGQPVHRRTWIARSDGLRIEDHVEGRLDRPARIALLLAPGVQARRIEAGLTHLICAKATIALSAGARVRIEPALWWPDMGVERPTYRIVMELAPGTSAAWTDLAVL